MKIITRKAWRARAPRKQYQHDLRDVREIFLHWTTDDADSATTYKAQCAAMRRLQAYHMDAKGWTDFAYHFCVFPKSRIVPRVFRGRPMVAVPSAQANRNTNTIAVAVFMGPGDKLDARTKRRIKSLIRHIEKHVGHRCRIRPHRAVANTECPGDQLAAFAWKLDRRR